MSFREQIDQLVTEALSDSAGALARDVTGQRPTNEEMIETLVRLGDAHSRALLIVADALDDLARQGF